jgi:hypothetical protein
MRTIAEQKIPEWLRTNCGVKGVDWKMSVKWNTVQGGTGIEIKIYDADNAMMFRLAFTEHLVMK